jgi:hypothetical protein
VTADLKACPAFAVAAGNSGVGWKGAGAGGVDAIGAAVLKARIMPFAATNGTVWNSVSDYRRAAAAALGQLTPIRDAGPLDEQVIPLVAVVRNEIALVGAFLDHYRKLGVGRFFIIDSGSTDGTFEFLKDAPGVDLWWTTESYAKANHGALWHDGLLHSRARGRWCLRTDADEFLAFRHMDRGLAPLVRSLQEANELRLHAPMLDMYSDRPIMETVIRPGDDPLQSCCWFDGTSDRIESRADGLWVYGGVRGRLFFRDYQGGPGLTKFPLVLYDDETAFVTSHSPLPHARNFIAPKGRLLHIKLHAGLMPRARWAISSRQYWQDSFEYQRYFLELGRNPKLSAHCAISRKYEGPQSLADAALI